jgi:hypothetical protein
MSRKRKEREKRKKLHLYFIVATYVYASSQGQRMHSARTNQITRKSCFVNVKYQHVQDNPYYHVNQLKYQSNNEYIENLVTTELLEFPPFIFNQFAFFQCRHSFSSA